MQLRVLSGDDLRRAVDMPVAIEAMREAFAALSGGTADIPIRLALNTAGGVALFMPGRLGGDRVAAKVVGVNLDNPALHGVPAISAVVLAFDARTGAPSALLEGEWLTALRTGAGGGLAVDLMARPEASIVALFGAGVQARAQLEAIRCVRRVSEVRVFTPTGRSADRLVRDLSGIRARRGRSPAEALEGADLVVAATTSSTPVFDGALVEPGAHVTGVGSFTPDMQEIDAGLVARARVVVDQRAAALAEAGDLVQPIREGIVDESVVVAELGEVVLGKVAGRVSPDEITFFKSVGNAVQDVAVAHLALARAEQQGAGTVIDL